MKRSVVIAMLLGGSLPVSLAAHPAEADATRCHMHKETGALHCPKRDEPEEPSPDNRPMRPVSVYYRNCSEARAAGVTPIRRGEPGYRQGLDGDNDGWACERYIRTRR
ncbi:excalibur calcium-binding domain-containing protein [Qipengyuania aquimaris]|uniref:excalibur calcium-binding domain-containing protein n=1 Tax=Qipengyuania aquimaris TaxID=255984 RepID=UPI001C9871CE|nr:excalibur calcium-binding domain-containing protein [Qipengyuania aquimaris]MBY6129104.1 excalibur calcium-binding domain-containing protein [Qipengyuania aquimaris]